MLIGSRFDDIYAQLQMTLVEEFESSGGISGRGVKEYSRRVDEFVLLAHRSGTQSSTTADYTDKLARPLSSCRLLGSAGLS